MRKTLPVQPDGSIVLPAELAQEIFGKAREAVVHVRSGCLVLSPVFVDLEAGELPSLLRRYHEPEALSPVLERSFQKGTAETVQFEGDLSVLSLSDVFLFLSASKKSGVLLVEGQAAWGCFFLNGSLVFATAEDPRHSLAAHLLRRQFVTEQDLAQGRRLLDEGQDPLAVLASLSELSPEEFRAQWVRCVEDRIYAVFGLSEGHFVFRNGTLDPRLVLGLPSTTTNYVMEATRRLDEWARLKDRLPAPETVLEVAEEVTASTALSPEEELVLAKVNGIRTVEEVVAQARVGDMEGRKAVASLLAAGLIRTARPSGEAPAASPETAAPAGLSPQERNLLLSRLESYNNVFSTIYQALRVEVGSKVEVILGAFFKGLEPGGSLLAGLGFDEAGNLPAGPLLERLAALSEEREAALVRDLNELLYFQLFAVKNTLGTEMEAGIVEMARSLLHREGKGGGGAP